MKRSFLKIASLLICISVLLSVASCGESPEETLPQTTEAITTTEETESDVTESVTTEASTTEEQTESTAIITDAPTVVTSEETTETLTETTETETQTETETETVTETETEETFPETNLELGEEIEYATDFTVSQVFSSNMVIQRGEFVRVWGWADESENGKKVSATFMGYKADALIQNGEWEIVFYQRHEANAFLGNDLVVYGGVIISVNESESESESESENETEANNGEPVIKKYVFEDVLIGDVFMVVGQSNVQYSIGEYLAAEPDLKWTPDLISENPLIRFNYNSNTQRNGYPIKGSGEICKDAINGYGWVIPNESNVIHLSAIGYLMAHQIAELTDNNIPVGISQFSANGRPLSVFMPNELAEKLDSDYFDNDRGIYIDNIYNNPDNIVEARYMYNQYMYPFERMPIAGIVWYQGEAESNPQLSTVYAERFTALMEYMRSTHNIYNKEFPVFYVEFPSVYRVQLPNGSYSSSYLDTGRIRAESCMIPQMLSNSYVAVCSDLWNDELNTNNVHPYCKYEQAERVTDLMQAVIYGTKTLDEATGPILKSYEISEDRKTIILKFTNVGDGLTTSDGGTSVNGFGALFKSNKVESKINVTAEITDKDTITITTSKVLYGIAYNFVAENFFGDEINLCNSYGNPASAFWVYMLEE